MGGKEYLGKPVKVLFIFGGVFLLATALTGMVFTTLNDVAKYNPQAPSPAGPAPPPPNSTHAPSPSGKAPSPKKVSPSPKKIDGGKSLLRMLRSAVTDAHYRLLSTVAPSPMPASCGDEKGEALLIVSVLLFGCEYVFSASARILRRNALHH